MLARANLMDIFSVILTFLFGTVIGSFLNVVSLRFGSGITLGGRSKCMSCGKKLEWHELIPLFSFAVQKGKCKKCKTKISWQYPLVEFIAGAVFALVFVKFPPLDVASAITTVLYVVSTCLLIIISVYDIRHKIIPDSLAYSFDIIALLSLIIGGQSIIHIPNWQAFLAGPVIALPFALIWLISKGNWMGLGDAKLVLGIGWLLGFSAGINSLILAFWIAALASVIWMFFHYKKFKSKTEIPFGPYLILGMYLVLIFGWQVIDFRVLKEIFSLYV